MVAHDFSIEFLAELVRDGLATATTERVRAGRKSLKITRVRITLAGRRALSAARAGGGRLTRSSVRQ